MTITATRWWTTAAAIVGAAGITLLATDVGQVFGGLLTGAGATAVPALVLIDRRTARLDQERAELAQVRAQHDAAFSVLSGQRQRILATVEHMVTSRLAAERVSVERRITRARADGYAEGAIAALNGALNPAGPPAGGDVVSLDTRRPTPAGTPR